MLRVRFNQSSSAIVLGAALYPVLVMGVAAQEVAPAQSNSAPPVIAREQASAEQVATAYLAVKVIEADTLELSRIADYQADIIELARTDAAAGMSARRGVSDCAARALLKEFCLALSASFPPASIAGAK